MRVNLPNFCLPQSKLQFQSRPEKIGASGYEPFKGSTLPFCIPLPHCLDEPHPLLPPSGLLASPRAVLPPQESTVARLTECVRTRSPSASKKGSGTWWSYTWGSPGRPWRLLGFGFFFSSTRISATATYKNPQTRCQLSCYQQALGRNGPSRKSTGWKPGAAKQTFRERVLRSSRYSSNLTLGESVQYLGMGERMLLNYTPLA